MHCGISGALWAGYKMRGFARCGRDLRDAGSIRCGIYAESLRNLCRMRNFLAGCGIFIRCGMRDAGLLRETEFMRNLCGIYAGFLRDAEYGI